MSRGTFRKGTKAKTRATEAMAPVASVKFQAWCTCTCSTSTPLYTDVLSYFMYTIQVQVATKISKYSLCNSIFHLTTKEQGNVFLHVSLIVSANKTPAKYCFNCAELSSFTHACSAWILIESPPPLWCVFASSILTLEGSNCCTLHPL